MTEELRALSDPGYAAFAARLAPTIPPESVLGVRVPVLRKFAKALPPADRDAFLHTLPHTWYDENLLHAILLCGMRPFDACMEAVEAFLPYVDNWAVCDTISPRVFAKNKAALLEKIRVWTASDAVYTCRFGLDMLMSHFLDDDFDPAYLEIPAQNTSGEYYVSMMVAWLFATALAKQWDAAVPYLEQRRLPKQTHRRAIQKARESFRITAEQKRYLNTLK